MNILVDIIPAKHRRYVYALVSFTGIVLGSAAIVAPDAQWVDTAMAVYAFAVPAAGLAAYANTKATPPKTD